MTWLICIPLALAAFWFASNSRAATETPEYTVIRKDDKIEIRDYPALTIATSPMEEDGMSGGFGQLFRFITGNNESKEKIAMTSPVLIAADAGKRTMSFIMPKSTAEKGVPKPAGKDVTLGKVAPARCAVLRFAGGRNVKNENAAIIKLKAWLDTQKIQGLGEPMFAYYDPPWTLIPFRRNEVMIRIDNKYE